MNKKLLCAALLGGLAVAQAANAQDFDDRWYITGSVGWNIQDSSRGTEDTPFAAVGFGKYFNPFWSFDVELNYQNPNFDGNNNILFPGPNARAEDLNWSQYGVSFDVRRHFVTAGRNWHPYVVAGLGFQRSEEEFDRAFFDEAIALGLGDFDDDDFNDIDCGGSGPCERDDGHAAGKIGFGVQADMGRVGVRAEVAARLDADNDSVGALFSDNDNNDGEDWFQDVLASVGVVIPLGPEPMMPVGPAPVAPNCADSDSDGDGVNDCDDRCPGSVAGQTIGPDGCPVNVAIDLRGVNFDFDRSTLRPDSIAILNEAIEILKRYPELRVEVAGHTDECGTDEYNQGLSERRSRAVYDYLTANGIDGGRLAGPNGYGESRPLENLGDDFPGCKSERNRRTELNVQN